MSSFVTKIVRTFALSNAAYRHNGRISFSPQASQHSKAFLPQLWYDRMRNIGKSIPNALEQVLPGSSKTESLQWPPGIHFKEYVDGMTAAHNYPNKLIPREFCNRIPSNIMIYPYSTTASGDIQLLNRFSAKSITVNGVTTCRYFPVQLRNRLTDKISILIIFSGEQPNSSYSNAILWSKAIKEAYASASAEPQYCFLCAQKSFSWNDWIVRNGIQYMTPQFASIGNFMGYSGRIDNEMITVLHLYRRELVTVLLVDPQCYIRWHSVGRPTEAALHSLKEAILVASKEKAYGVRSRATLMPQKSHHVLL